jgi:hypothetical protein
MTRTAVNYTSLIDDHGFCHPGEAAHPWQPLTADANHAYGYATDCTLLDTFNHDSQYTRELVTKLTNGGPDEISPRYFAHLPIGRLAFDGIIEVGLLMAGNRDDARIDFSLRTCAVDDEAVPSWDDGEPTQVEAIETGGGQSIGDRIRERMGLLTGSASAWSVTSGGVETYGNAPWTSGNWRGLRVQVSSKINPTMTAERELFLVAIAESTGPRVQAVNLFSIQVWPRRLSSEDMG